MSTLRSVRSVLLAVTALACGRPGELPMPAPAPPEPGRVAAHRPEAERKAEPAPPPVEHRLKLCALAPATAAGLRTLDAVHVAGAADTVALVGERRVPLAEALGPVRVASQTTWFQSHLFLDLKVGAVTRHFAIYDLPRVIEAGELAYLGEVDGLPVYAAAADVASVRNELGLLLGTERDLARLIAGNAQVRSAFRTVSVLYVPLASTGCVFQPLLRVEVPEG